MSEQLPYAYALQADGRHDPIAVPTPRPVLSWRVAGPEGVPVNGFAVRRAARAEALAAAPVHTADRPLLPWPGADLRSGEVACWQAGVYCGSTLTWSAPAAVEAPVWDMGRASAITHPAWTAPRAQAPLPELARTVTVTDTVERARLAFTGNGVVVPRIDDAPAVGGMLEPGYASPNGPTAAVSWDVTAQLPPGERTLTLALGSGMAFLPREADRYTKYERTGGALWARGALTLYHRDGRVETVTTGAHWRARLGPTTAAHWYGGESYDAAAGDEWGPVALVPGADHTWRWGPSIEVTETLPGRPIARDGDRTVFDLGTNAAGRPRLRVPSPSDARVRIAPGELLDAAGTGVDQSTTGSPIWDEARLGPDRREWSPSFVYHGARYLEVTGAPAGAEVDFAVMRAGNEPLQSFTTSNDFLSRLRAVIDRAVQSNMYSVFTDCPHREKLGWIEQLHVCFDALARGWDVKAHLMDAIGHMVAAQTPTGLVPSIAPEHVVFDTGGYLGDATAFRDDVNWGRAILEVPWRMWRHWGDPSALRAAWPAAQRYLDHLAARADGHLLDHGLGDWVMLDESTPVGMVATWGYARAAATAARTADVLGDAVAHRRYRALAADVWSAWHARYRDTSTGRWGSGSQASWALALDSPVLDAEGREAAYRELRAAIDRAAGAFTVGEIALPALIAALTDHGDAELLLATMRRTDVPGYGLQLASGATALTESWQADAGQAGVVSQNHFMLGAVDAWILGHVAGLRQHPDDVGWRHVVIDPLDLPEVDSAALTYESPSGRYHLTWRRGRDGVRRLSYTAPPGTRVEVRHGRGRRIELEPGGAADGAE